MTELVPLSPLTEEIPILVDETTDPWAPALLDAEPTLVDTAALPEDATDRHSRY